MLIFFHLKPTPPQNSTAVPLISIQLQNDRDWPLNPDGPFSKKIQEVVKIMETLRNGGIEFVLATLK
jgi:hypothetical protein